MMDVSSSSWLKGFGVVCALWALLPLPLLGSQVDTLTANVFDASISDDPTTNPRAVDYTDGTVQFDFYGENGINGIFVEEFTLAPEGTATEGQTVQLLPVDLDVTFQRASIDEYDGFTAGVEDTRESLIYVHDGASNNEYDLYGGRNNFMEEAMTGNDLSDGAENIFQNNGNRAKNVERVDYVYTDGFDLTNDAYRDIGFVFFERDANNQFYVAAITEIDENGNAVAFGDPVLIGQDNTDLDWGGEIDGNDGPAYGLPADNDFESVIVQGNPDESDPSSFDYEFQSNIGTEQGIGGVYLSIDDLLPVDPNDPDAAVDTFYGYALFAGDLNTSLLEPGRAYEDGIPADVNSDFYNKNTSSSAGGGDLYGGGMLFAPVDLTIDPDEFTPIGQDFYWDLNNAVAGSGVLDSPPTPNLWDVGTVGETTTGNASWGGSSGLNATRDWEQGKTAVFSAGNDAVSEYLVEVEDDVVAHGLRFENGTARVQDNSGNAGTVTLVERLVAAPTPDDPANEVEARPFIQVVTGLDAFIEADLDGDQGFDKTDGGRLFLSGDNDYTGPTNVVRGDLIVQGGNAIGDSSAVTLEDRTALILQSSETIGSLEGAGDVELGSNTLTVGGNNTAVTVHSGTIEGDSFSGLTKEGDGILRLTTENSFTGLTRVNQGVLELNTGVENANAISRNIIIGESTESGNDILLTNFSEQIGDDAHSTINETGIFRLGGSNRVETIGDLASDASGALVDLGDSSVLQIQQDGDTIYAGSMTGTNNSELVLFGGGSLTFSGAENAVNLQSTGSISLQRETLDTFNATENPTTLILATDNVLNTDVEVDFDGGRLSLAGAEQTIGTLDLNEDSFLDFGSEPGNPSDSIFTFEQITFEANNGNPEDTLTIENWMGNPGEFTTDTSGDPSSGLLSGFGGGSNQLLANDATGLGLASDSAIVNLGQPVGDLFVFEGYGEAIFVDADGANGNQVEIIPTLAGFFEWDSNNDGLSGSSDWYVDDNWVGLNGGSGVEDPGEDERLGDGQWALFDDLVPDGEVIIIDDSAGNGTEPIILDQILIQTVANTDNFDYSFDDNGINDSAVGGLFGGAYLEMGDSGNAANGFAVNDRNVITYTGDANVTFNTDIAFSDDLSIQNNGENPLVFNDPLWSNDASGADASGNNNSETLDLTFTGSGTTNIDGGIYDQASIAALFSGGNDGTGEANIIKEGEGTLNLNARVLVEGDLIIEEGTVVLNNQQTFADDGNPDNAGNPDQNTTFAGETIIINGGTLVLDADEQIDDQTNMVLNGGTLQLNGNSETLGTLTLAADSVIDFGDFSTDSSSDPAILTFADSSGIAWDPDATLTIRNWRGTPIDGDGDDQFVFGNFLGTLTEQQLSQVVFEGYGPLIQLDDGEIVPVPEPRAYAAMAGLLALVGWRERQRLAGWWAKWRAAAPRS